MCGRVGYIIDAKTKAALRSLGYDPKYPPDEVPPGFNVAPIEPVPIVHQGNGELTLSFMRWWLHPHWSKDEPNQKYAMFNARAETVNSSRAFKGPMRHHRCIMPVSYFIEWRKEAGKKVPMCIKREDQAPLLLAAIYDLWQDSLLSCAVLTQQADPAFAAIHHRMPLILETGQAKQWLDVGLGAEEALEGALGYRPTLHTESVDPRINNARNKAHPRALDAAPLVIQGSIL